MLFLFLLYIVKEDKPLLLDLQNLITPNYSSCWKSIGNQLGIPTEILDVMEADNPTNLEKCCNDMLKHWLKFDAEASWNKIVKAIDSPPVAAADLASRLKAMSIDNRYKPDKDNRPLTSPKHFTSVALIHHKGQQTKQEILAVAALQTEGSFDLHKNTDNEYFKQSKCTKDISDLFAEVKLTNDSTKRPGIILIEGVPGIGKTILSKEIEFQWANGKLLSDKTLLFLIYLRDIDSDKINSLESFVNYVSYSQVAKHILKYITDNKGKNVTIVFDGFDELSEKIRNDSNSFLYKLMTKKIIEMPYCNVVITSRPNASVDLHDKVDLRVEILGFTNEDRKAYIYDALNNEIEEVDKILNYLNDNPAIDTYCYIPLNMTILLSIFASSNNYVTMLPRTQTEINEKFICTTISIYIKKSKGVKLDLSKFSDIRSPCDVHEIGKPCIGHEKGVPYGRIMKEISKLAFKALEKDKIVFTSTELQEACPCLEAHSDNWDGLGLLKAVKFFSFDNNERNVSYNFLHFTTQEILAAYHVTMMSEEDQIKCMEKTFWSNRYYNMWIMYVGLTKNQLPIAFQHFLSGNWFQSSTSFKIWWNKGAYYHIKKDIINDKVKRLYLFQCFSEAGNKNLCQYVGKLLEKKEIDLSDQTLSIINLYTLSLFLGRSTTKEWNTLNLSKCFIGDDGIKKLFTSFTSNNRSMVRINTLNLSHNNLTQSSTELIASLVLKWNVKSLNILYNGITRNILNKEIMYQIMQHAVQDNIFNLYLCSINDSETIFARLSKSDYLNFSCYTDSDSEKFNQIHRIEDMVKWLKNTPVAHIDIISHMVKSHTTINYFNSGTIQFKTSDIAFIIRKNKCIEDIYLPCFTFNESIHLMTIFDELSSNTSLRYLDMRLITIDSHIVKSVAAMMTKNEDLEEIRVCKLLLKHDDFQHLKNYIVKFRGLKHLSITYCALCDEDVSKVKTVILSNNELESLDLSHCQMSDVMINKLAIIFFHTAKLRYLNLCNDQLPSNEVGEIFSSLRSLKLLESVDLTGNKMKNYSSSDIWTMIKNNKQLQKLCLPKCITNFKIIIEAMQTISSLEFVDFSTNKVDNDLASSVASLFANNSRLKQLNITELTLHQHGFDHLKMHLIKLKGLKILSIADCTFSNQDLALLETFVCSNYKIRKLIISNCKISDHNRATVTDSIGIFDQLENLELNNNSAINLYKLSMLLSCSFSLKQLTLCDCRLKSNEINQILMVLKHMRHLEYVNLSGIAVTDDLVGNIEAMIINNKHLWKLCLPNCILNQAGFIKIIQAMQTVSLKYVGMNKVDIEQPSDFAVLITNNSKELKCAKFTINEIGFQHLKDCFIKIKELKLLGINGCIFTRLDTNKLMTAINNNPEIQELNFLTNCKMKIDQLLSILSCSTELQWLDLSECQLQSNEIKQILKVLKEMTNLQCLNLYGNSMTSDAVEEMVDTIKQLQKLYLPECDFDLTNIFQDISSLRFVDFSANKVNSNLAMSIAKNNKLEHLNLSDLELNHSGFQHLKGHLEKIKGVECITITNCTFTKEDATSMKTIMYNNPYIKELHLRNCKIPILDQLLPFISCSTKLTLLDLSNCQLQSKETMKILVVLKLMKCLLHVDLSANYMTSDAAKGIAELIVNNKNIQTLSLPNCDLNQNNLKIIIKAMKNASYLQYIDLSTNKIDNELASDVATFCAHNNKLQQLKFTELKLDQSGFDDLKDCLLRIHGIKYFNLNNCSFTDQDAIVVTHAIRNNSEIQELDLSNCTVPHGLCILKQLKAISLLQCLKLNNVTITDQMENETIMLIDNFSCLNHLEMAGCNLRKNFFIKIIKRDQFKNLSKLNLSYNGRISNEVDQISPAVSCNFTLKSLDLSNCQLGSNETMQIFKVLKNMRCLEYLDLHANVMKNNAVSEVAAMIANNQNLQEFFLPNCDINQTSLRVIFKAMKKISSLKTIGSNYIQVNNELAIDLANVVSSNMNLEIRLSKFMIKQTEFQHLKNVLIRIRKLDEISINHCNLVGPESSIEALISNNTMARTVNLAGSVLSEYWKNNILKLLHKFTLIENLNLSSINFNNQIGELITVITKNKKLHSVRLSELSLNQITLGKLSNSLVLIKGLKHLIITDCTCTDQDGSNIATVIVNSFQIEELNLSKCKVLEKTLLIILLELKNISSLKYFNFNNIAISDQMEDDIIAVLCNNNNLEHLEMAECNMSKKLYVKLIECATFKNISKLNLSYNIIVSKEIKKLLLILSSHTKLKSLDLSNCQLYPNEFLTAKNWSLEELNISSNNFTASGVVEIIKALSRTIKILDISSNFEISVCSDEINMLASTLAGCLLLQELNISHNLLTFDNALQIARAIRSLPNLRAFNMSYNITSYFLECEFLIDVILSINIVLKNLNVCGRNIRPRFKDDYLFSSLPCDENSNRFVLQNFYCLKHVLINRFDQKVSNTPTEYTRATETCPIPNERKFFYYVDCNGGTFYNQEHDFAIVIPPGAISQGDCIEIQVAVSKYVPHKIPDGYFPISSYFWFGAHYTFKIPVYLIMRHYAIIEKLEDINQLCVLQECFHDHTNNNSERKILIKEVLNGVYFDYDIGYCIFATDHFCSACLYKKKVYIPEKFSAILYTFDTEKAHIAEVCFCPSTCDCREVMNFSSKYKMIIISINYNVQMFLSSISISHISSLCTAKALLVVKQNIIN